MKLIVSGATGLVGTEVIRQSLKNPKVASVIALSRRPVSVPTDAGDDADKLKSLVLQDFTSYPEDVKAELADADACIWALAITPLRSRAQKWEEVVRVNQEYPLVGFKSIAEARGSRSSPFRFMYMSGEGIPRDLSKKPKYMADYLLMRGETENQILAYAAERKDAGLEVCVVKPGLITSAASPMKKALITAASWVGVSKLDVTECVAAMIDQVMNGFEKDLLTNAELVTLGQKALEGEEKP